MIKKALVQNEVKIKISDDLTIKDLQRFFADRPGLPVNLISKSAKIKPRNFAYIVSGHNKTLSKSVINKVLPVLRLYGYKY